MISISLIDDEIPELNENIVLQLRAPTSGSIIDKQESTVEIVILANDNAGGIVSFHQNSRAVIGSEGTLL